MQLSDVSRSTWSKAVTARAIFAIAVGGACYALAARVFATPADAAARVAQTSTVAFAANRPVVETAAGAVNEHAEMHPLQRFTGKVGPDLSKSLLAAGVPERQGREYVAVLGRAIQLEGGLSVEDKFDLVLERRADGKFGQLLYVGLDRVARADVELMRWTNGARFLWVNADGVGGENPAAMDLPVRGRLTSPFGRRFHPILGYVRFHKGVDLAATAGTPILAAADGRVREAGWRGGYGQEVEIAHGAGLETRYGHMSRIAASVGEVVRKGQVIGWVGSTGLSTGPHVHFEVTKDGRPVDPLAVKLTSGAGHLEGEKLQQFDAALRGLLLASRKSS